MPYAKLRYLQRFEASSERTEDGRDNIGRIIQSDYMGASEFEQGGAARSFRWLRAAQLSIFPVKKLDDKVTFYVIGTQECLERFNEHIDVHLRDRYSDNAQEPTGLYQRFAAKTPEEGLLYRDVKAWLDIGGFLSFFQGTASNTAPPVLFTADRFLAIRMYLEFTRTHHTKGAFEFELFDKVYCYKNKQLQTVVSLNEDNTLGLKAYGKKIRVNKFDVWPEALFPLDRLKSFGVF